MSLEPRRVTRRRFVWAGAGALTLMVALLTRWFDSGLLHYDAQHPGFWAWAFKEAILVGVWTAIGLALWRFLPDLIRGRRLAAVLLAALLAGQIALGELSPRGAPINWSSSGRKLGYDPAAYTVAAGDLIRRVVTVVPPRGRVAVVHDIDNLHRPETYTPEVPLFLFYLTTPRIYYFHHGRLPDRADLIRAGVGWTLDLRGATYTNGFGTATPKAVRP